MQEGVDKICAPQTGTGGSPPSESDKNKSELIGEMLIVCDINVAASRNLPTHLAANYMINIEDKVVARYLEQLVRLVVGGPLQNCHSMCQDLVYRKCCNQFQRQYD